MIIKKRHIYACVYFNLDFGAPENLISSITICILWMLELYDYLHNVRDKCAVKVSTVACCLAIPSQSRLNLRDANYSIGAYDN